MEEFASLCGGDKLVVLLVQMKGDVSFSFGYLLKHADVGNERNM